MEGVLKQCGTVEEAAIQALIAGCDLLLLGGKQLHPNGRSFELTVEDIKRIHRSIVDAVQNHRVSEERVNQAVEKILKLKQPLLQSTQAPQWDISCHEELAKNIASLALHTVSRDLSFILPLREKKLFIWAPKLLETSLDQTSLLHMGQSTDVWFNDLNPSSLDIEMACERAQTTDVLLICSYNVWKYLSQMSLIQSLIDTGKPVILFGLRDPLDASLFPEAALIINTSSPTPFSIQAACNQLP